LRAFFFFFLIFSLFFCPPVARRFFDPGLGQGTRVLGRGLAARVPSMRSGYWLLLAVGLAFLVFRGDAAFLQADVGSEYLCKPEAEISHLNTLQPEEKKRCLEYCNRSLFVLCLSLALSDRHRLATAPAAVRACSDALHRPFPRQNQGRRGRHGRSRQGQKRGRQETL